MVALLIDLANKIYSPFYSEKMSGEDINIVSPCLPDDATTCVSHLNPGPKVDGVTLVVRQAVLNHLIEVQLELKHE